MQTSLNRDGLPISYGSQGPSRPDTPTSAGLPSDVEVSITVRVGSVPLPERRSTTQVWCSTLATALKTGLAKAATQTFSATTGALAGNVIKTGAGMAVASLGPWPVILIGGATLACGGWKAGARAAEMMSARSDASSSGTGNGLSPLSEYTLRLAPVVIPLGRALVTGWATGSPLVGASCIGASLASMVCSGVRDTLTAPFKGVLPESKLVDAQGGALHEAQVEKHQIYSTVLATALDGGLAMGGNSGLAPSLQGLVAPFNNNGEVIVYGALRGGFGLIQEGAKAIAAIGLGGRLDTVDGKGISALQQNLFDEAGRKATVGSIGDNLAMRMVVNSFTVEAMTGLEDAVPGGEDPQGPMRYFTSLALGAGESRSTFVDQGRSAQTKLDRIVAQVESTHPDHEDDARAPPSRASSGESPPDSPTLPDNKRTAWGDTPLDRLFSQLTQMKLPVDFELDGHDVTLQSVSHGVAEDYIIVQAPEGLSQRHQELAENLGEQNYRIALGDALDGLRQAGIFLPEPLRQA